MSLLGVTIVRVFDSVTMFSIEKTTATGLPEDKAIQQYV